MKINLSSITVNNQDKALKFYTEILGFVKKTEIPMGEFKWVTVVSADRPFPELVLEPNSFPPSQSYQKALYEAGIPVTAFEVEDIQAEYKRLMKWNVNFKSAPSPAGPVTIAIFDDTCGNWVQIYEVN